jgi:hypothetical protein
MHFLFYTQDPWLERNTMWAPVALVSITHVTREIFLRRLKCAPGWNGTNVYVTCDGWPYKLLLHNNWVLISETIVASLMQVLFFGRSLAWYSIVLLLENYGSLYLYWLHIYSFYDMTRICHIWLAKIVFYKIFFIYTEKNVKGMQSHFSKPFEQKGNSPVRSCLIASRGSHMIWDSAHDLGFRNLNYCCGVAVSWRRCHVPICVCDGGLG